MSEKFPLLNGETLDFSRTVIPGEVTQDIELREDFAKESLPWWLTYETDNGPASPTIEGLPTSGGATTALLNTGSTSTNDKTNVSLDAINYDNWSEIKLFTWGVELPEPVESHYQVLFADGDIYSNVSNGFFISASDAGVFFVVIDGGTEQNTMQFAPETVDFSAKHSYGMHFYEFDDPASTGHNIDWYFDGKQYDSWRESLGWPSPMDLTPRVGVTTDDTAAERTVSIDGIYLELVP